MPDWGIQSFNHLCYGLAAIYIPVVSSIHIRQAYLSVTARDYQKNSLEKVLKRRKVYYPPYTLSDGTAVH